MDYLYLKALHIIFVVTWFSGLFYIVRLFIYYKEAEKIEDHKTILQEQYKIMIKRLWYGITWPSAILTAILATWLLFFTQQGKVWLLMPWMHLKLSFVVLLYLYHFICHRIYKKLINGELRMTSFRLRLWNEGATVLLVAIIFLIVLKDSMNWIWGIVGLILFSVLLILGIRIYKKIREEKNNLQQ